MAKFNPPESMQTLVSSFGLKGNVTKETRGVGSMTGVMISCSSKWSRAFSMPSVASIGTFLLACYCGYMVWSSLMSYSSIG